jgi:hypothetical protein
MGPKSKPALEFCAAAKPAAARAIPQYSAANMADEFTVVALK